jgi:hypothetical protein
MKSLGTKETQGINGDAARLQHVLDVAARMSGGNEDPCPYPAHRITDWRLGDSPHVVCGVCHEPAKGLDIERVAP